MACDGQRLAAPAPDILRRAAAGDVEAFALIYQRYQHVVYRFGRAMTGSASAAEDVTHDTFVALFADLARYDPARASFTSYLYGVVRNLSRERARRERRFLSLDGLVGERPREAYFVDPDAAIASEQLAATVRRALASLPLRYRELIVLCDLHAVSYAEAAHIVGASTAAVRSRLHRARQLLRQRLSPDGAGAPQRATAPARYAI